MRTWESSYKLASDRAVSKEPGEEGMGNVPRGSRDGWTSVPQTAQTPASEAIEEHCFPHSNRWHSSSYSLRTDECCLNFYVPLCEFEHPFICFRFCVLWAGSSINHPFLSLTSLSTGLVAFVMSVHKSSVYILTFVFCITNIPPTKYIIGLS